MAGEFDEVARELDAFAKAKKAGWTARGGWPPPSPATERRMVQAIRGLGERLFPTASAPAAPKPARRPAPRHETREEKLASLRARVRAGVPGVLAKASADFDLDKLSALDVSRIEAQCHRLLEATS